MRRGERESQLQTTAKAVEPGGKELEECKHQRTVRPNQENMKAIS